jgi:glycerate dehydrogenase
MRFLRNMTKMASNGKHFNIVALETFFTPLLELTVPAPHTFSITEYQRTTAAEVPERIKDADIVISTVVPIREVALSDKVAPNLKFIAVQASGTDSVDLAACKRRGIRVLNSPNCNVQAVVEHAVALYFAVRRSILPTMRQMRAGEWPRKRSLISTAFVAGKSPRSCGQETAVIIGYGGVGRHMEHVLSTLGMKVIIAGRKNGPAAPGRVDFDQALSEATVIVLCCPRTPETQDMISTAEFDKMRPDAVLVNVARGGIVVEGALLKALQDGKIAGAATDVFDKEPAGPETSVLLGPEAGDVNLVVTPHTAWLALDTTVNYQRALQENINSFIQGDLPADRLKA